jgi:hypothetical protein
MGGGDSGTGDNLPVTADEIDEKYVAWCLQRLSGEAPMAVTDVAVGLLSSGTSGAGLHRVTASADGQPISLVLKLNGSDDLSENRFYRDLATDVPVDTPAVADARILTDDHGWLVMEELQPVDDLTWTEEHYHAVVVDMATMHAAYWNNPALTDRQWLWRPTQEAVAELVTGLTELADALSTVALPGAVASVLDRERLQRIRDVLGRADDLIGPLLSAGTTLVHGDYWFHNVLVTEEGRRAVIDWQGCRVFSGIWEICYFVDLLRAVGPGRYRDLPLPEEQVTAWYLEALSEAGVGLTAEEFRDLYLRARVLQPMTHWFLNNAIALLSGEFEARPGTIAFLHAEFARWDHDVDVVWTSPVTTMRPWRT